MRRIGCRRQFRDRWGAADGETLRFWTWVVLVKLNEREMKNQGGKERTLFDKLNLRCR